MRKEFEYFHDRKNTIEKMKKNILIDGKLRTAKVTPARAYKFVDILATGIELEKIGAVGTDHELGDLLAEIFGESPRTIYNWLEAETGERQDEILKDISKLCGAVLHRGNEN